MRNPLGNIKLAILNFTMPIGSAAMQPPKQRSEYAQENF